MLILSWSIPSYSEPSVSRGLMLKMHGFEEDAKRAFIDLLYNDVTHEEDKADALYQLGLIAFNNKDIGLAVITEFPRTDAAKKAMSYKFMLHKDWMGAYWEEQQHLFDVLMGRALAKKDALESTTALSGLVAAGGAAGAIGSKDKGGQAIGSGRAHPRALPASRPLWKTRKDRRRWDIGWILQSAVSDLN